MVFAARCCLRSLKSALALASINLTRNQCGRIVRPVACQHMLQIRKKHDEIFGSFLDPPVDKSIVYIDEVLKNFGDRGIRRDGDRVAIEDMFKLFQMEVNFVVNESKLHREMLKLQRALHPDKFTRKDRTSKLVSDQLSCLINEAYETLKNPYKRALYFMRILAGKSESEIEKKLDNLKMDPEFLSRMMNLREDIESDRLGPKKIKLAQELQIELDSIVLAVNRDFKAADFDSALMKLGELKFLANCHSALNDTMTDMNRF